MDHSLTFPWEEQTTVSQEGEQPQIPGASVGVCVRVCEHAHSIPSLE